MKLLSLLLILLLTEAAAKGKIIVTKNFNLFVESHLTGYGLELAPSELCISFDTNCPPTYLPKRLTKSYHVYQKDQQVIRSDIPLKHVHRVKGVYVVHDLSFLPTLDSTRFRNLKIHYKQYYYFKIENIHIKIDHQLFQELLPLLSHKAVFIIHGAKITYYARIY